MDLGVLILVLASMSGILAIVGNTWAKENRGLKKVTATGWAAICLISATLAASVLKEVETLEREEQKESAAIEREQKLLAKNEYLSIELKRIRQSSAETRAISHRIQDTQKARLENELRDQQYRWEENAPPKYLHNKEGYEGGPISPEYRRYERNNPRPAERSKPGLADWID